MLHYSLLIFVGRIHVCALTVAISYSLYHFRFPAALPIRYMQRGNDLWVGHLTDVVKKKTKQKEMNPITVPASINTHNIDAYRVYATQSSNRRSTVHSVCALLQLTANHVHQVLIFNCKLQTTKLQNPKWGSNGLNKLISRFPMISIFNSTSNRPFI